MPENDPLQSDLQLIEELAKEAGQIAMKWFGADPEVWMKEGQSPVSEADFAVDQFLKEKLLTARPSYGWLSEETEDNPSRLDAAKTFVVDPIDGTRGFLNGSKQWCISIGIVEERRPIAGVLQCPALGETITAAKGCGTLLNGEPISAQPVAADQPVRITGPRSLERAFDKLTARNVEPTPFIPSLAYRVALVSMAKIDLTIARASAKDWDLAAADIIACEAGACLTDIDGAELQYNCSYVRHGALVCAHGGQHTEMLDLARQAMNNRNA